MYCYLASVVSSAGLSLRPLKVFLVRSISPPIRLVGLVAIPMAVVLLFFATALWISVFFLLPLLLTFAWMVLQPYRLWVFLRNRMTGTNFSG